MNLVDWSSLNVLAVGLGNCVYLWNASTNKVISFSRFPFPVESKRYFWLDDWLLCMQVVKLCELGIHDSVCSVSWAHRGTHLAVGTSNGELQVR